MLIPTIEFEIHDFKNQFFGEYLVKNTPENYQFIAEMRHSRAIHIDQMYDFEFSKKCNYPSTMYPELDIQVESEPSVCSGV